MVYENTVVLKDGRKLLLRSGTQADGQAVWDIFSLTHAETDYLLSYPDENSFTPEQECEFLKGRAESRNAVMILAFLDGKLTGVAGIEPVGEKYKVRHRADLGISVAKEYWRLGIGRALTQACVECAKKAGFAQLELTAVADNEKAIALYSSVGFVEYGRNPKGFNSKYSGYQTLVYMSLDLE